jgi:hypothetical protein
MDKIGLGLPPTHVDIADNRRKYHTDAEEQKAERQTGRSKTRQRYG